MRITGLKGIFTGTGFAQKSGRRVQIEDAGFLAGPLDILIDDRTGKVSSIEKSSPLGTHSNSFDGHGLVACAGFVDSHTHALYAGDRAKEYFLRWRGATYVEISQAGGGIHNSTRDTLAPNDLELCAELTAHLRAMLESGTTLAEVKTGYGGDSAGELRLLRTLHRFRAQKVPSIPELRTTFLGLHSLPKGTQETAYVDSMISILSNVQREGLAEYIDAFPEQGFFTLEESVRFVEAGLKLGLKAKIHADEITDMNAAATFSQRGALSVDHLQQINAKAIALLANAPTVATLMPATSFFLGLPYANARKLLDAGCRVALATDLNPGTAPRGDMSFTQLLGASQLKMSAAEILCACTFNGAAAMGLEQERGTLQPGQEADVLLFASQKEAPPQELLETILLDSAKPNVVFRHGTIAFTR
ncbi:MAG: imidazolonepropionase [Bdellovibrionales bacterium]|nr:imidazolonepropionase [Bdellovibrionales bacterium]